jgi:hypothetical protein
LEQVRPDDAIRAACGPNSSRLVGVHRRLGVVPGVQARSKLFVTFGSPLDKIGDILEFANLEAGRYPLDPRRVDVSEIVYSCVNDQVGRAFSRRIILEVGFAEPIELDADPLAVKRVLTCLITNALTYTPEGGAVRLGLEHDRQLLTPRVAQHRERPVGQAPRRLVHPNAHWRLHAVAVRGDRVS